jgi:hypothetical protein
MKFLLDKYIAGLCFYRTAFPVQKSGLKSSAFRSKSFPQISSESYRHNAVSNRFSSHLSTSPTNAATFVSRGCGGYTLGFAQRIAHNGTHGETGGVSDGGAITTLRAFLRGSETLRGRVSERRTLPLLGLGREVLSKNAESLRDSDALMRVAVPRRRGPAGLRDLFRFCRSCGLYTLRSVLSECARRRVVSLPSACFTCC